MTDAVVLDTNVLVVADDESHEAGPKCVSACVRELVRTQRERRLLVDFSRMIQGEYEKALMNGRRQPGVGVEFYKWVAQHVGVRVQQVWITPDPDPERDFAEFPDDPALRSFDKSDRKFVAVALASKEDPTILHATDRGWKRHREPLRRHGVRVRSLCDAG